MESAFPGFSHALSQVSDLEHLEFQPFESRRLQSAPIHARTFMQNVYKCRNDSYKKRCMVRAISQSECQKSLNNFTSCVSYVASDTTPQEYRTHLYCSKRELELMTCITNLTHEILNEISGNSFYIV